MRWLPVYLSSVSLEECESSSCLDVAFTPICSGCGTVSNSTEYSACIACHECRQTYHGEFFNFEDGVCMTTTEYGILTGIGFSFTFSIFGLFAGFFVDLQAKRDSTILGVSALFCALTTLLTAHCTDFKQVVLLRAFLGAFQAFGAPASVHLIMSHFERAVDRPLANASYTIGVYLGAGLSSLSVLISEQIGWKATFSLAGYIGISTALCYELLMDTNVTVLIATPFSWFRLRAVSTATERNPLLSKKLPSGEAVVFSDSAGGSGRGVSGTNGSASGSPLGTSDSRDDEDGANLSTAARRRVAPQPEQQQASNQPYNQDFSDLEGSEADLPDTSSQGLDNFTSGRRGGRARAKSFFTLSNSWTEASAAVGSLFRFSGAIPGAMVLLLLGSCLRFAASISVFVFVPVLISRRFPSYGNVFSIFNALVVLSCGSLSAFLGGKLGQIAVRRYGLAGLARLIAMSGILCLGPFIACILSEQFWPCMVLLAFGYLFGEAWMGASMALLQGLAPVRSQGLAMSLYLFLNWNLSAATTDTLGYLDPGTVHLAKFMTTFVSVPIILSSCCFVYLDRVIVNFMIENQNLGSEKESGLMRSSRSAD